MWQIATRREPARVIPNRPKRVTFEVMTPRRLRLSNLDSFTGALLALLGTAPLAACGDSEGGGTGGGGGAEAASSGSTTVAASTSTSGGGGEGGSSSAEGGGPGSGGGHVVSTCTEPTPILVDGADTGFERCDGYFRRREALACPAPSTDDSACDGACSEDEYCDEIAGVPNCLPLCATDDDCGEGKVCGCGLIGARATCIFARCATAADCAEGQECAEFQISGEDCQDPGLSCTLPGDACRADADCAGQGNRCEAQNDGPRECVSDPDVCGRPFLVAESARLAPSVSRGDWLAPGAGAALDDLDGSQRAELADAWTRIGRMEHASIAAFARFALQLLALGAPADLIEQTHLAMRDETRHALLAFGLATRYGGEPVGPGPLAIDGALVGADDVRDFVRLTIREGCIGETVAALEAGEAEATAADPVVKSVLAEIAHDERAHAELAWRAVQWAVTAFGDVARGAIGGELASVEDELRGAAALEERVVAPALVRHGLQSETTRARLRRATLRQVVAPGLRALLPTSGIDRRAVAPTLAAAGVTG